MSKVKIEINYAGVGELLKSQEMADCVSGIAQQKASACGDGYGTDVYRAGTRVIASVFTETGEAKRDNYDNNTLLRAVST